MKLPPPPTDNLYKFMAILGLILLSSTIVIIIRMQDKSDKDFARVGLIGLIKVDLAVLGWHEATGPPKTLKTDEAIENWRSAQKEKKEELETQLRKLEVSGLELEEFAASSRVRQRWARIAYVLVPIALVLTIVGFSLWYMRLQKFLDMYIRNKAESVRDVR